MKNRLIGLYELITGIFGVLVLLVEIKQALNSVNQFFSFILGIILFAGTAYAGYALINNLRNGYKYSVISQSLQSIGITYSFYRYLFTGSAFLSVVINDSVGILYKIQPIAYKIYKLQEPASIEVRIFIIPLILLVLLSIRK
ncbi:MAG: hypothetical protein JW894_11090 [Bacteroidales bacterium]|nr:hypothetical protein [Bacteroidales bacterium]